MTNQEKTDAITNDLKALMEKHGIANSFFTFKEFTGNRGLVQLHQFVTDNFIKAISDTVSQTLREQFGPGIINNQITNSTNN